MKIIFGLGNPGLRYAATRHNCGFLTLDCLAEHLSLAFDKKIEDNLVASTIYQGEKLLLAKPQLYMNLSGFPLARLCHYYKVDYSEILIVLDDLALPPTSLRFRRGGSDGKAHAARADFGALELDAVHNARAQHGICLDILCDLSHGIVHISIKFHRTQPPILFSTAGGHGTDGT